MSPPADARHEAHWEILPARPWPAIPRIDPYFVWAETTRYRHMEGARIPVAIEMKAGGQTAREFAKSIRQAPWRDFIWMSALYRDPPPALAETRFCTAQVTRAFFTRLAGELADRFERFTLAMPISASETPAPRVSRFDDAALDDAPLRHDIGRVIVGVCDDDVPFTHRRFSEDASGTSTRFQCVWTQDDASNDAAGLGYGHELMKSHIDDMLRGRRRMSASNVYRMADHARHRNESGHETHEAPLPLIGVRFGAQGRAHRDAAGFWLDVQALDAVRYIVRRGQDIAGPACHALVNLSYGAISGPRDGSSLIECALDELMDAGVCSIVIPAGNSNPSRSHGATTIEDTATLRCRAPHHKSMPSFIEIWFPAQAGDPQVEVCIVPPMGSSSAWITLGDIATYSRDGDTLCTVVHLGRGARGDGHMALIALAPGASSNDDWLIRLRNRASTRINAVYFATRHASVCRVHAHQPRA